LLAGLVGLAASTLLFAYAPGFPFLVAARALQGASAAVSWTAGLALLAASFPAERRGAAMGKAFSAMSVGALLGPVIGGFLFERAGRAAPFLFGATVVAALEPVLPQLASTRFDLGPSGIGLSFAAATLASVLAYPLAGAAADRLGARSAAAFGAALAAIGSAFVLAPTAGLVAKAAESIRPPAYGAADSLYNVAYSTGLAAAPMASALAYGWGGIRLVAVAGALASAALALAIASGRKAARE
jgi:MFS family permease